MDWCKIPYLASGHSRLNLMSLGGNISTRRLLLSNNYSSPLSGRNIPDKSTAFFSSLLPSNLEPLRTTITWTSIQLGVQWEQNMNKTGLGRTGHDGEVNDPTVQ